MEKAKQAKTLEILRTGPPGAVVIAAVGTGVRFSMTASAFYSAEVLGIAPLASASGFQLDARMFSRQDAVRIFEHLGDRVTRDTLTHGIPIIRTTSTHGERLIVLIDVEFEHDAPAKVEHPPVVLTEAEFLELADSALVIPLHPNQESTYHDDLPPAA